MITIARAHSVTANSVIFNLHGLSKVHVTMKEPEICHNAYSCDVGGSADAV